jgi:hypothetical protein
MDKKALIKALRDTVQSASNTVASGVSAPVDLIAAGLRKVGMPIPQAPVGGSQWMENMGLTVPVEDGIPKLAGETLGMIVPMAATAKAPQIAAAANRGLENLAAPRTLNTPGYGGQRGAIVWHGSPHKFEAFDASKIGTGSGTTAYGHGAYFAEHPNTAKLFQKDLSTTITIDGKPIFTKGKMVGTTGNSNIDDLLVMHSGDIKNATKDKINEIRELRQRFSNEPKFTSAEMAGVEDKIIKQAQQELAQLRKIREKSATETGGYLYKVDLPDEAIARMLDWDKPLSQQPEALKAIQSLTNRVPGLSDALQPFELGSTTGQAINDYIARQLSKPQAAQLMREAGIPGIRYLDAGSRAAGGTSNFVVFPGEERLLKILERNNQPMGLMGVK